MHTFAFLAAGLLSWPPTDLWWISFSFLGQTGCIYLLEMEKLKLLQEEGCFPLWLQKYESG